ncbi:MAG: polysaccharide pyruvyl transferase family protein [Omnitrophica WOR_2 bacterium]
MTSAKILLLNLHSSSNAGDAALTAVTIHQLKQHFPECCLTLAMDDPGSHSGEGRPVQSLNGWVRKTGTDGKSKWRFSRLLWLIPGSIFPILTYRLFGRGFYRLTPPGLRGLMQAYIQSDLAVSVPGGFLYSSGSGLTLLIALFTLWLARLAGKPFYIFPQSIGPFRRRWERRAVRRVLSLARVLMVREPVSLQELKACGISHPRTYLLPDMAFSYQGVPRKTAEEWLTSHGIDPSRDRPLLGMTLMNWGEQNPQFRLQSEYEDACASAARFFIQQYGGKVLLFSQVWGPFSSQDDRVPARRAAAKLPDLSASIRVVEDPLPPDLLISLFGLMDVFIGTRMHSNIFALSQGVPAIAIGYQHKTRGIAEMAGIAPWVIDIRTIDAPALIEKLKSLWTEREAVRKRLQQTVPALIRQASRPGSIAAEDYCTFLVRAPHAQAHTRS